MTFRQLLAIGFAALLLTGAAFGSTPLETSDAPQGQTVIADGVEPPPNDGGSNEEGNPGCGPLAIPRQRLLAFGGSNEEGNPGPGC